jgi:RimJ/RimL family protein N-acetyltransferase
VTDDSGFTPRVDARPDDVVWPEALWPPAPDTALEGDTVRMTPTVDGDLPELWAAMDDEQVWRHLPSPRPADVQAMRAHHEALQERGFFPWTLRLVRPVAGLSPPAVVGWSCYLDVSQRDARCEIGGTSYAVPVWGTKVNPEAKLLLLTYAFEELDMGRVQLKTDVRNVRSQRAIAGIGATYEGVLRRYNRRADGTMRDSVLFSVTAEDWPRVHQHLRRRLDATD